MTWWSKVSRVKVKGHCVKVKCHIGQGYIRFATNNSVLCVVQMPCFYCIMHLISELKIAWWTGFKVVIIRMWKEVASLWVLARCNSTSCNSASLFWLVASVRGHWQCSLQRQVASLGAVKISYLSWIISHSSYFQLIYSIHFTSMRYSFRYIIIADFSAYTSCYIRPMCLHLRTLKHMSWRGWNFLQNSTHFRRFWSHVHEMSVYLGRTQKGCRKVSFS